MFYKLYITVTSIIYFIFIPFVKLFNLEGFKEREGKINIKNKKIWIHAASLGEILAAEAIINALNKYKDISFDSIVLSTMTSRGKNLAIKIFSEKIQIFFVPIDTYFPVTRTIKKINPEILILIETEIWPVLIMESYRNNIPVLLINGMVSKKSFREYHRIKFLLKPILNKINKLYMVSEKYKDRMIELGANPSDVCALGNIKYGILKEKTENKTDINYLKLFNISSDKKVIVCGSIHRDEEDIIINSYISVKKTVKECVLIIVPRYIEDLTDIKRKLAEKGLSYKLRTDTINEGEHPEVIIINKYGELFDIYSIAAVTICGGSFIPNEGGHNPIEPAAWGKMVLYGPSMDDFEDAKDMLEKTGGGMTVKDGDDLTGKLISLLSDKKSLDFHGEQAKRTVEILSETTEKYTDIIFNVLQKK